MEQVSSLFFTLIFFASILGTVVAVILFFLNRSQSLSPRLLAAYLLMISITSMHVGLTYTNFYIKFPHFWRSTSWSTFCAPAIAFLYVRTVLQQSFRLRKWDWLLFIPALLYSLNLLPYYLSSATEKREVINRLMADSTLIASEPEGTLPLGWGVIIRLVFGLTLIIGQFYMLAKMRRKTFIAGQSVRHNEDIFRWLFLFTMILTFLYVILIGEHIFHFSRIVNLSVLIFFTISGTICFISFYLLARPSILYGIRGWVQESTMETTALEDTVEDLLLAEKRPSLTIEQGIAYKEALESHLNTSQCFLITGYKIRDLSVQLGIPIYQISAFINQEYGKNFNEFINDYRVDFMTRQLEQYPEKMQFTLEALAKEAGFNSRNSFINSVKRKTGKTPSEYFGSRV
jgi:AraC-like DNA-binding protein